MRLSSADARAIVERGPVVINVDGLPMPKGSKTAFVVKGRAVLTDGRRAGARAASIAWREAVADAARRWLAEHGRPAPIDEPISVVLGFRLPRPASAPKRVTVPMRKPDLDKLARHALDSLSGLIYSDDARIVVLVATKAFAENEPPGVRIQVGTFAQPENDAILASVRRFREPG